MKLSELLEQTGWEQLTDGTDDDREITGCYLGDLLSWVMGRAQRGNVWITIMSNVNIVAVASLTDCAGVVLAEGVTPEQSVVDKANSQGVALVRSPVPAYESAMALHSLL